MTEKYLASLVVIAIFLTVSGETFAQRSKPILPFTGAMCKTGPGKEINKHFAQLRTKIFASGSLNQDRIIFAATPSQEYLYILSLRKKGNSQTLCLHGGGREIDFVISDKNQKIAKIWPRTNRFHHDLAKRFSRKSLLGAKSNIEPANALLFATAFFVKPGWGNSYDEVFPLKLGGKTQRISRGRLSALANKKISQIYAKGHSISADDRKDLRAWRTIFKNTDHGFSPVFLWIDRKTSNWALTELNRKNRRVTVLLKGTKFGIPRRKIKKK